MRAYALQGRAVYEAVRSRRPEDLVRAIGSELIYVGATGEDERRRAALLHELTEAARASGDAESEGFATLCLGYEAFLRGELSRAQPALESARRHFQERNSLAWLSKMATRSWLWVLQLRGRYAEFRGILPALVIASRAAGDRHTWSQLSALWVFACAVDDDVAAGWKLLAEVRTACGGEAAHSERFVLDRAQWLLELYAGDHRAARASGARLQRTWRPVMRFAHVRTEHVWCTALLALARDGGPSATRAARGAGQRLLSERLAWPRGLGHALLGAAQARAGERVRAAAHYAQAAGLLAGVGFDALAEAAALQHAHLLENREQTEVWTRKLLARGVRNLPRWLAVSMPGPAAFVSHAPVDARGSAREQN
jgi:hypothetical protein